MINEGITRSCRRLARVALLAVLLSLGTTVAAHAATGTYVQFAKRVDFFFGISAGNASSKNFSGYGPSKLCANAPNVSNSNFNVTYRWNRTLRPDTIMKQRFLSYNDPKYVSAVFETRADRKYHTDATWSYVAGLLQETKGFSRAVGTSC